MVQLIPRVRKALLTSKGGSWDHLEDLRHPSLHQSKVNEREQRQRQQLHQKPKSNRISSVESHLVRIGIGDHGRERREKWIHREEGVQKKGKGEGLRDESSEIVLLLLHQTNNLG